MPFFSGLAQGFNDALTQNRQLVAQQDEQRAQRENAALLHLTTSDDPVIASHAMAGLLQQGQTGKPLKGIRGFFGETAGNPALPTIRALIEGGKQVTAEPATMGTNVAPGSAAQPSQALTEPGAATPPPSATASLGMPGSLPNQDRPATTANVPRQVFFTHAQQAGATEFEQSKGRIGGIMAAARQSGADPTMMMYAEAHALNMPMSHADNNNGDRTFFLGNQNIGTIPGIAKASQPQNQIFVQAQNLMAADPNLTEEAALAKARSGAAAATTATQTTAANRATISGQQAAVAPEMSQARLQAMRQRVINEQAALPGIQMSAELKQRTLNGQLTADEAYKVAAPIIIANKGTTDDLNEMVGALTGGTMGGTPQVPAAAAPPPGGAAAPVAPAANVAPPAAPGAPPTAPAANVAPPAPGAPPAPTVAPKPGLPSGKSLYKPNAQEQGTLDTIEAAKPMMERVRGLLAGHETENTWSNTFQGVKAEVQSAVGHNPSNPMYAQLDPLIQHLKVFALGPYLHGIRNGAFVKSVSDNTPSLTDTPARITQKLTNLDQNFKDIEAAVGSQKPGTASATAPPAGGNVSSQPGPEWSHDPSGRLLYNGKPF